jgi:MFS family permease
MPALARFLVVFVATLAAAATIGKLVPHIPRLAAQFDVSLAAAGFLVSSVMLPGAFAGPLFGALVDRVPPRRVALFGLALGALSSFALPFAPNLSLFLLLRLLEGAGYTFVVVAATLMVVEVSASRHRSLALATFSSFAPLGFALGQLFAAGASDAAIALAHAAVLGFMCVLVAASAPRTKLDRPARVNVVHALRHPPALRTGMAFGCVAGLLLGAVAVAPLVLASRLGFTVEEMARLTAAAALPGIAGRFLSGWLLGRSAPLRVFGFAAALGLFFIPAALIAPLPLAAALACFAVFQICMGALAGILSAMLPQVAPSPAQFGTVTGLANQMVTAGNLVGPPLVLGVYAAAGATPATAVLVAALALSVWLVSGVAVYRRALAS